MSDFIITCRRMHQEASIKKIDGDQLMFKYLISISEKALCMEVLRLRYLTLKVVEGFITKWRHTRTWRKHIRRLGK